ncbi:MAG: tetratricopeptide repeat protein, partial [Rhodothermales bacterium]
AYAEGVSHLQGNEYQQALSAFEKGLQKDSSYVNNLIGKGQAHQRLDQEEKALEAYTRAKNLGEQVGDSESVRRAKDAIRGYYQPRASALLAKSEPGRSDARQAIDLMDDMQEHVDPDANTYYYLAAAYNILGEHERAIEMIDTGLEMHNGSRTDRARFYFEKGEALRYLGDVAEAKEAYRNAAFGSYKQPAEHFIETL